MEQQQFNVSLPLKPEIETKVTTTNVGAETSSTSTVTSTATITTLDLPIVSRVRWIDAVWNAIGRLIAQKGINEFSRHELIRGHILEIMAQTCSTTGTPTRAIIETMNDLLALGRIVIVPGQSKSSKYMVATCNLLTS